MFTRRHLESAKNTENCSGMTSYILKNAVCLSRITTILFLKELYTTMILKKI
jgi:hypothetical protein